MWLPFWVTIYEGLKAKKYNLLLQYKEKVIIIDTILPCHLQQLWKNRNSFWTIKPKKVQFVLYLHTVAIELINRMKTNEIGEIVWKKVPNVSYSSIIRILTNFILEPPVSLNHKVLLQAIPITFSKSLHKSSTCNHEPQFPVLKRIINLIFKVWGIKRSGKSLYQILYLW